MLSPGAANGLKRMRSHVRRLASLRGAADLEPTSEHYSRFLDAVNSDLNMPRALSETWGLLKSEEKPEVKCMVLTKMDAILGLGLKDELAVSRAND